MRTACWTSTAFALAIGFIGLRLFAEAGAVGIASGTDTASRRHWTDAQRTAWAAELRRLYVQTSERWPAAHVDEGVEFVELGPVPSPPHPQDNPPSKEKEALGRVLFFDPKLSGSGHVACASCHDPDLGWADGRTVSFGHARSPGTRNAPTIMGTAFAPVLFWDGRAASLEEQALAVLHNPAEFRSDIPRIEERLASSAEYRKLFARAFGDEQVTIDRALAALATFVRGINPGRSKFDAFLAGKHDALDDAALRGLHLFRTEARCINCHHGPLLSDYKFHNLGLTNYGRPFEDLGRYAITRDPADVGRFRTPSLRNVTRTGPYMHHGLFELDVALRLYNAGMMTERPREDQKNDPLFPRKSPHLQPLNLSDADLADLAAFLSALEEPRTRIRPPQLPAIDASSEP